MYGIRRLVTVFSVTSRNSAATITAVTASRLAFTCHPATPHYRNAVSSLSLHFPKIIILAHLNEALKCISHMHILAKLN